MALNRKSDGSPRRGRPPGPMHSRGARPWDLFRPDVLRYVAANPDLERYKIAAALGLSLSELSRITCSPRGVEYLARLRADPPAALLRYKLVV